MRRTWIVVAAAAAPLTLIGLPAWADPCVTASVASYETAGFSCFVGSIDFSNIAVSTTVTGTGVVTLGNFTPFSTIVNGTLESGLSLNYTASTGTSSPPSPPSTADVAWTYNVTDNAGSLIDDAYASLTGSFTGTGSLALAETLSNGVTLSINIPPGPATDSVTFPGISTLGASKDVTDLSGPMGSAVSSIVQNGFSEGVPGPTAGAGVPGLILAGGFLFAWRRSRRTSRDASALPAA